MNISQNIAKHFREVHFGGNWTFSNLRDTLSDVTWQESTVKISNLNTIATLVYHTHYFVDAVLKVLRGGALDAHDKFSFDHPPIESEADWSAFLQKVYSDAESFAALVEALPENRLEEDMADPKYGSYYRNLHGIIEHTHYHLGQIAIIKKLIKN